jgi:hypothetical protein
MSMTENTSAKPPFQKWYRGMPTPNPKGRGNSPSKFSRAFLHDVSQKWAEHGADVLEEVRRSDPSTFLRVCSSLIPKELLVITHSASPVAQMSEQELQAVIVEDVTGVERLRAALAPLVERVAAHDPALAGEMHRALDG